jgi:ribose transport system ATP-binding protein
MMFGALRSTAGAVILDGVEVARHEPRAAMGSGIAYIPEDRPGDAAFATMSVVENLSLASTGEFFRRGRLQHRAERTVAHGLIKDFSVKAPAVSAPLATLSGGNQQKVILARWLRRRPRLILLDEPTQGVDVGARAEIWQLVRRAVEAGACALVATSDLEELAMFCDRALVLVSGRIAGEVEASDMTQQQLERQAFGLEEAS